MKIRDTRWFLICGALAAFALAGCGGSDTGTEGPAAPSASGEASQIPADVEGAALGTRQSAEFFSVELRVDGTVKRGENRFVVTVNDKSEDGGTAETGAPETEATVRLLLTMPGMGMFGSETILTHAENGRYEGLANLTMDGEWQANVTVTSGSQTGDAVYDFRVGQP